MIKHLPLTALVVHESMFGNTAAIAESVARGLELGGFAVTRANVERAPGLESVAVDLLVVGAPTHVFSLSRPSTRADALRQGAPAASARIGIREWLDGPPTPGDRVRFAAMFDTRVSKVRHVRKAAGTQGAHLLKRLGYLQLARPEAFLVDDVQGPLVSGETLRAVTWGRDLARACEGRMIRPAAPSS
jgi:flavodoxin